MHRFVDRDMLMRYTGLGVGHMTTRESTRQFEADIREATNVQDDEDTWVHGNENEGSDEEVDEDGWETDDASDDSQSEGDETVSESDASEEEDGVEYDDVHATAIF